MIIEVCMYSYTNLIDLFLKTKTSKQYDYKTADSTIATFCSNYLPLFARQTKIPKMATETIQRAIVSIIIANQIPF